MIVISPLQVMLRDDQTFDDGRKIAKWLMEKLRINTSALIECAYMDLILEMPQIKCC